MFEQVLAAARDGDDGAWRELYVQLAPSVLGYLRFRGAPEPEDLAGEVFLQMVRDLPRFDGGERQLRAWVLSIARHRALDDRRSRARRPVEPATEEVIAAATPSGDVEAEALERLATADVLRSLSRLSSDQRDVLVLRLVGDLTIEEVASVIGKRPGAVKALQRRGLQALTRAQADTPP